MENGEDWLLRPVLAGMCSYESLKNGTINLEDLAKMNDSLTISRYNDMAMSKR